MHKQDKLGGCVQCRGNIIEFLLFHDQGIVQNSVDCHAKNCRVFPYFLIDLSKFLFWDRLSSIGTANMLGL